MIHVSSSISKRSLKRESKLKSMMKKMRLMMILKRCKSVSAQLGRSYSYTSLRSQSARRDYSPQEHHDDLEQSPMSSLYQTVLVGRTKKPYLVSKQHLKHPLLKALVEKQQRYEEDDNEENGSSCVIIVKCEVVLFDHLLWMLENGDQTHILESLDDFAHLYLSP